MKRGGKGVRRNLGWTSKKKKVWRTGKQTKKGKKTRDLRWKTKEERKGSNIKGRKLKAREQRRIKVDKSYWMYYEGWEMRSYWFIGIDPPSTYIWTPIQGEGAKSDTEI
jgi:hypothetical protein